MTLLGHIERFYPDEDLADIDKLALRYQGYVFEARVRDSVTALMKVDDARWNVDHIWGSPGKGVRRMGRPTSEQIEAFRRDGAVYLPGFLARRSWWSGWRRAWSATWPSPARSRSRWSPPTALGGSSRTSAAGEKPAEYRDVVEQEPRHRRRRRES